MEILGVGVPEIAFIILIALILLGPKDMVAAGRTIGRFLRKFLTSPTWQAMRRTGEELQQLPTKLVREAGLEDLQKEVQGVANQIKPLGLNKTFDESQIFNRSTELVIPEDPAKPDSITPQSTPPEQPEEKPEPPNKPDS
jgi:Sec-independent protein translocase protein TatA